MYAWSIDYGVYEEFGRCPISQLEAWNAYRCTTVEFSSSIQGPDYMKTQDRYFLHDCGSNKKHSDLMLQLYADRVSTGGRDLACSKECWPFKQSRKCGVFLNFLGLKRRLAS